MMQLLQRTRRPDITFSRNGRISITARVVHALAIHPGDSVNVAFHDGECYLLAVHHGSSQGRHIAACYPTKKGSHNFCANSVTLCRLLLDGSGISAQRASFLVGAPQNVGGQLCLPIIYKHPL